MWKRLLRPSVFRCKAGAWERARLEAGMLPRVGQLLSMEVPEYVIRESCGSGKREGIAGNGRIA